MERERGKREGGEREGRGRVEGEREEGGWREREERGWREREEGGWRERGKSVICRHTHTSLTPSPLTPHRFVVQECGRVVEQRDEMERKVETLEQTITASQQQTFEVSM